MTQGRLPFHIESTLADLRGNVRFTAILNGDEITCVTFKPGDDVRRNAIARKWAADHRLRNGTPISVEDIAAAIEAVELAVIPQIDAYMKRDADAAESQPMAQAASLLTDDLAAELAWNVQTGSPDYIVYDRHTKTASRAASVRIGNVEYAPPAICTGIVTPGHPTPGSVIVPTSCDETGTDEDRLRADLLHFIDRYVELPPGMDHVAVEYVLLSWVFDGFDELPYMAFRTADAGRGKSRALETVGTLCYRPIFCGGGSTAAATLRLLDAFWGTLIADEMDQRDSELAAELTKILNQGFQVGRPLVRCVGDASTPKPFRCFSPKLFALRKGFSDDATESRVLSITMRQRTRRDVPINLPRARFDLEAGRLRNRLLAWRFANLNAFRINPALADPRLEDRLNQIGLPLLAVARDADARARIVAALLDQQDNIAADRADSLPGETLTAALAIARIGEHVRPADVANEMNRRRAAAAGVEPDRLGAGAIKSHKVGWILKKDLELPRDRDEDGTIYRLDPARLRLLSRRYGITPETLPELSSLPADPTGAIENADFGYGNVDPPDNSTLQADEDCHSTLPAENRTGAIENAVSCNHGNHGNFPEGAAAVSGKVPADTDPPPGWTAEAWQAACGLDQDGNPADGPGGDDVVIV